MGKHYRHGILILIFAVSLLPQSLRAQIDDIGFWFGASVEKQITREMQGSLTEMLRLNHDGSDISQYFTDAGLSYTITKKLKAGIHYRFINSNQDNYYSKRHRFYADVAWKEKISLVSITLRERIQQQFTDYNSSETGKIPIWTLRSKLTAKFDLDKKYSPYISGEMYFLIDDLKEDDNRISRFRYEAGFSYDFNRIHSINPYVLFQNSVSESFSELIYGISYSVSL